MKNYPELFTDLRIERVKHVLDLGHLLASPIRDQNGSRVFIINARNFIIKATKVKRLNLLCRQLGYSSLQLRGRLQCCRVLFSKDGV